MADIIRLDDHRRNPDDDIKTVERTVVVLGVEYTVRTTGDGVRGWFSVRDRRDRPMFVKPVGYPQELIGDLILAWIDGHGVGRRDEAAMWQKPVTGGDLL